MRPRRLWLGLLILGAVAAAGGGWWAHRERRFRDELATARRDRAEGRPASAARRLARLEAEWPGRGEVAFELGLVERARGRSDAALAAWGRVPPGSMFAGRSAALAAQVEIRLGRLADAEDRLSAALTQAPPGSDRAEARETLVRLLRSEGRFGEARRLFLDGFGEAADPVPLLKRLYRLDIDPFAVEGVRVYLDNAERLAPEDDRAWLGRAHLATRLGHLDEADRWLSACLQRRPTDAAVWRARLEWARAADRPEAAREALPHLPADEAEALDLRAWFAARRGDPDEERRALERLLALDPGRTAALVRLAELGQTEVASRYRARKAEADRARESYRALLASRDPSAHADELARLADALGLRFEARKWSEIAGKPAPELPPPPPGRTLADLLPDLAGASAIASKPKGEEVVIPQFADDAEAAGLRFVHDNGAVAGRLIPPVTSSGGVALLDYDGDGRLDVYVVQGGPFPPDPKPDPPGDRLFRNRGDDSFEDTTESSGLAAIARGYGHGVAVGDFDNDGDPDLFVTRWRSYALYRNRGDGTFEDITEASGLSGDRDWPTSAAFADLDNDGDLDLYVCHYLKWDEEDPRPCADPKDPSIYKCNPRDFPALPDHAFRNDGGRFVDVTAESGIVDRDGRGLGVVAADLDEDGKIDLFVANDTTANYLFRNLGGFRFEEVALESGVAANAQGGYQAGMGVACGDLDGDGRPDLAVTNFYNESTTFFRNLGDGLFADHTAAVGLAAPSRYLLGFGIALFDANNDGRLDLLTANGHVHDGRPQFPWRMPAQLLVGGPSGRLIDVSDRAGASFAVPRMGRGLAAGDLDDDGRIDALLLSQGQPLALLHNRTDGGHWLAIRLEGRESNRDGVGARVEVEAGGRRQVAWRFGGGSYQSAGDPRLHFGLGPSARADRLEVRWPSGRSTRVQGLAADAAYRLREGEAGARREGAPGG